MRFSPAHRQTFDRVVFVLLIVVAVTASLKALAFRRVEIARPLRKTCGSTTALREWKVWTWPRFASASLSSAFEHR
jgi:hypothetical protein